MNGQVKHTSQEQEQVSGAESQQSSAREFANTEELLRHDAALTPVPPRIAERLQESVKELPKPKTGWWKRWTGGMGL
jgi:hypothetical protein